MPLGVYLLNLERELKQADQREAGNEGQILPMRAKFADQASIVLQSPFSFSISAVSLYVV